MVDATNYVLHELGQPLHAFDASKINGNKIEVKTLAKGTKFTTLDGVERSLHEEDLMICNADKPMCIAGVFGGLHSGVTADTTAIFLESAYFDPVSIRKTAKRHGLNTDASFRFERGIDINLVEYALQRAAILITEIAGGEITSELVDLYPNKMKDYQVFLTFEKIDKLVGEVIPRDTIKSILASLDIKVNNMSESGLGLTIPFYRVDVQREVDVIEEILRVYGYNTIAYKEKLNASIASVSKFEDYKLQNVVGNLLASQGFYEIMTNSLSTPDYDGLNQDINPEHSIPMLNPLSNELSVMRQSLLYTGLEAIAHNINRKNQDLAFFEFGKTYHQFNAGREEHKHLCLYLSGNRNADTWVRPTDKTDFYYLKAQVENILLRLGITANHTAPVQAAIFSEGLSLAHGKQELVHFGLVKKTVLQAFGIKQEVLFADFNWDNVITLASKKEIRFKDIPKYPEVKRDFALLLDDVVSFKEVYEIAKQTEKKLLKNISLFDVYKGKNLPTGKKSYAVSFTLSDESKTLKDKQIDKIMKKLQLRYESELGAELR